MPRAEAIFTIVTPDNPGEGPVFAEADSIFNDSNVPLDARLIPMPDQVGDVLLARGMKLRGKGHIFIHSASEVRPEELHIIQDAVGEERPKHATSGWD